MTTLLNFEKVIIIRVYSGARDKKCSVVKSALLSTPGIFSCHTFSEIMKLSEVMKLFIPARVGNISNQAVSLPDENMDHIVLVVWAIGVI